MKPQIQKDMKIGLIDVDGHAQKKKWGATIYPNLALCKIASYHRSKGDDVEWYNGLFGGEYDLVYMAKVFSFSQDYSEYVNAKKVIKGGTGYDIHSVLPQEIDDCQPDYSIYPHVPSDTSYGFLTRGCPNTYCWFADFVSIPMIEKYDILPCIMSNKDVEMIIPYNEDTKHLVGTTDEAPEYYRYWED